MCKNPANSTWQNDLSNLLHLRSYLRTLMEQVKMTELSASELVTIITVLNTRRLVCDTVKESLRPMLRLSIVGQTTPQLVEQDADLVDEFTGGDITEPLRLS